MNSSTTETTLRPLERSDEAAIMDFARSLPEHDLLFVTRDLTEPRVVRAWLDAVEGGEIHSQVALVDGEIVGYSALVSDPLSWSPHVGEIRVLVGPGNRRSNIGRSLAKAAREKGIELGLEKLIAKMTVDQRGAIALFEELGFRGEALLRDHVKMKDGTLYDLAILSLDVEASAARRAMIGLSQEETEQ